MKKWVKIPSAVADNAVGEEKKYIYKKRLKEQQNSIDVWRKKIK